MYSVETKVVSVNPNQPDEKIINQAAQILNHSGLVSFPTETVYGLGANALDEVAVGRVYEVKRRPSNDPMIVHIASLKQLHEVAREIPDMAFRLAENFWAGALTLVLKKHARIASNVSMGLDTVAVRMPNHKIPLALIETSGLPIAAPSANLFTKPSPTIAQHVLDDLNGHVDMILDGGSCTIGLESTILNLTSDVPTVLRPGGVAVESLKKHIPNLQLSQRFMNAEDGLAMPAPGMSLKHYSPNARLILFTGTSHNATARLSDLILQLKTRGYKVGMMITDEDASFSDLEIATVTLGSVLDLNTIAQTLFAKMRALDALHVDFIFVRAIHAEGLGLAIADRLLRASEQHVFDLDGSVDVDQLIALVK